MELLRKFDTEEAESDLTTSDLQTFLDKIAFLFVDEHIWKIEGHTKLILDWLERPRIFSVCGKGRILGGHNAVTKSMKKEAVSHMKNWVVLVRQGLLAEFPCHKVLQSMSIFETVTAKNLDPKVRGLQESIERLCSTFSLDPHECRKQFFSTWPMARCEYAGGMATATESWATVLLRLYDGSHGPPHPNALLTYVLCRKVCWSPSSSGLEQILITLALLADAGCECMELALDEFSQRGR